MPQPQCCFIRVRGAQAGDGVGQGFQKALCHPTEVFPGTANIFVVRVEADVPQRHEAERLGGLCRVFETANPINLQAAEVLRHPSGYGYKAVSQLHQETNAGYEAVAVKPSTWTALHGSQRVHCLELLRNRGTR